MGYRFFASRAGRTLRLSGWVRNLADGRVEAYAAGPAADLATFESQLREGPTASRVQDVVVEEAVLDARIEGFQIR